MKFPFRDFWSSLIVKFGDFTYKSSDLFIKDDCRLSLEIK